MKTSSIALIGAGLAAVAIVGIIIAMDMDAPSMSDEMAGDDVAMQGETAGNDMVMQDEKIRVFASFYPYYEFTRNVAGDHALVEQYLPTGVEAHDWEPRAAEIQSLKDADVFVYNGLGLEPYVDNLIDSGEFNHVIFVKASDGVDLIKPGDEHGDEHGDREHAEDFIEELEHVIAEFEEGHLDVTQALEQIDEILHEHEGDGHDHGNNTIEGIEEILHEVEDGHFTPEQGMEEIHHFILDIEGMHMDDEMHTDDEMHEDEHGHHHDFEFDPHIWLDPILVKQQVLNIKDGLIEADPGNMEHYEQNAQEYIEKLDALDMNTRSSLSSCGKDTFVPFHNAFTYFAERYDLHILPLGGLAPDAEASATEIAEFVDFVRENDIKVIFAEELVDPRLAQVIADEAGAEVMLLSPLEALSPEEVGTDVTYLEKMEQNIDSLRIALECQ